MTYIGIDPGLGGAVAIKNGDSVSVFDVPTAKTKKGKEDYDLAAMSKILAPYKGAVAYIEDVHAMPGNGGVSMFNFGRGKGLWEMAIVANGLTIVYVSPQTWKKDYPELVPVKAPKKPKGSAPKTKKEKAEAAKQKRLVKALAKETARKLAGTLYPQLADRFKTVNSDGRAEAVLIAKYAEKHYMENKE